MMTMMTMMVEDHHDHVEDEDLHHQPPVVCKDQLQIIKGKRSKRPRQPSPFSLAMGSSTTTTTSDDSRGFVGSPSTSFELSGSTEEDQDMANCLILLAQGDRTTKSPPPRPVSVETRTTYVHQCKTCNRCFPSFQALGGHRASHKKPKVVNDEEINKGLMFVKEDVHHQQPFNNMNTTLSLQVTNKSVLGHNNKVPKVHECSMCGAEFSSGQALGGHMRRHRTLTNVATTTTTTTTTMSVGTKIVKPESEDKSKKQRTVLQLDLNLPAPEDHDHQRETKFSFASKQEKLLLFSTSSLVDCHY